MARLQRHPRVNVEKIEGLRMFLAFNVAHKPFDNKLVRQVVNYSIDGPAIIKNIFDGIGYSINGPVGSNVLGADLNSTGILTNPKRRRSFSRKRVIRTVATCSSTIPPAVIRKIRKFVRWLRPRW